MQLAHFLVVGGNLGQTVRNMFGHMDLKSLSWKLHMAACACNTSTEG